MDRFIGLNFSQLVATLVHLKSNMDRFIVKTEISERIESEHLKSNMDRFIG